MRLTELIAALPAVLARTGGDAEIHTVAADSRQVQPGDLFVATPGVSADGHRFIAQAVAAAVIGDTFGDPLKDMARPSAWSEPISMIMARGRDAQI